MVDNGAVAFPDNVTIRDAIAKGEIDVGLINHYYVAQAIAEEGPNYPVAVYFPPGGLGSLMLLTSVGVLESSDRKPEAFAFVRSLLSDRLAVLLHLELEGVPTRPRRRAGPLAHRPDLEDPGLRLQPGRPQGAAGDDRADEGSRGAVVALPRGRADGRGAPGAGLAARRGAADRRRRRPPRRLPGRRHRRRPLGGAGSRVLLPRPGNAAAHRGADRGGGRRLDRDRGADRLADGPHRPARPPALGRALHAAAGDPQLRRRLPAGRGAGAERDAAGGARGRSPALDLRLHRRLAGADPVHLPAAADPAARPPCGGSTRSWRTRRARWAAARWRSSAPSCCRSCSR